MPEKRAMIRIRRSRVADGECLQRRRGEWEWWRLWWWPESLVVVAAVAVEEAVEVGFEEEGIMRIMLKLWICGCSVKLQLRGGLMVIDMIILHII